jgi:protein phosphatase
MFAKLGNAPTGEAIGLFCVADGMGGMKDGHRAAEIAVSGVQHWWENRVGTSTEKNFTRLFETVNTVILDQGKQQKATLGTTLSLLYIRGDTYHIAHTGDSRIYLVQKKLLRTESVIISEDQTWGADKLREQILTREEISQHTNKNMLTGCLGVFEEPRVFMSSGKLEKSGTFIICSDGLYRTIPREMLEKMAIRKQPAMDLADALINTAAERGTKDNATVVAVKFESS